MKNQILFLAGLMLFAANSFAGGLNCRHLEKFQNGGSYTIVVNIDDNMQYYLSTEYKRPNAWPNVIFSSGSVQKLESDGVLVDKNTFAPFVKIKRFFKPFSSELEEGTYGLRFVGENEDPLKFYKIKCVKN